MDSAIDATTATANFVSEDPPFSVSFQVYQASLTPYQRMGYLLWPGMLKKDARPLWNFYWITAPNLCLVTRPKVSSVPGRSYQWQFSPEEGKNPALSNQRIIHQAFFCQLLLKTLDHAAKLVKKCRAILHKNMWQSILIVVNFKKNGVCISGGPQNHPNADTKCRYRYFPVHFVYRHVNIIGPWINNQSINQFLEKIAIFFLFRTKWL